MNYTHENYGQDKEIANKVYKKYFYTFKELKDDLVQVAVIKLWELRNSPTKTFSVALGWKCAHDCMANLVKSQCRFLGDASIFEPLGDDLAIIDTLEAKPDVLVDELSAYTHLFNCVQTKIASLDGRAKEIISMYMNRRPYQEIAKCVGVSKQTVGVCVKSFRVNMAKSLGLNIA